MTFQEQIDDLVSKFVPADKLDEAKKLVGPLNEAMTRTFKGYSDDIDAAKSRLRAAEGIKPEEYAKMEKRVEELTAALVERESVVKDLTTKYDTSNKTLLDTKGKLSAVAKETAIRKALTDAKLRIAPDAMEEVFASIDRRVVTKDDGSFVIPSFVISHDAAKNEVKTAVEFSVTDYLTKEWAVSPYAKRVLLADFSSGGAHAGPNGLAPGGSKPWKEMNLTERTALYKSDPAAAQQLIDADKA